MSAKKRTKGRAASSRVEVKSRRCRSCPALCCKDLVLLITKPRTRQEIESLKWQLQFDTVSVFITNYRWHAMIKGRCMYLDGDDLCTIYDRRPRTCRRHNPPDCERYGEFWDVMIRTPDALESYLQKEKERRRSHRRKDRSRAGRK